jgi:hypothetical protein
MIFENVFLLLIAKYKMRIDIFYPKAINKKAGFTFL